jgi:Fe-S-cluster-containing hydrogenase component 2
MTRRFGTLLIIAEALSLLLVELRGERLAELRHQAPGQERAGRHSERSSIQEVAQKCDLCIDTPYWNEKGGPGGKQACVQACPMEAIKFTEEVPSQVGDSGYKVNLRGEGWPLDKE